MIRSDFDETASKNSEPEREVSTRWTGKPESCGASKTHHCEASNLCRASSGSRCGPRPADQSDDWWHAARCGSIEISARGAGKAFISNLVVDQQHRRRGVAAKLIDAAITAARQGFSSASLEARPSDTGISPQALVAMYQRQGFRNVGKSHRGSPMMERKL